MSFSASELFRAAISFLLAGTLAGGITGAAGGVLLFLFRILALPRMALAFATAPQGERRKASHVVWTRVRVHEFFLQLQDVCGVLFCGGLFLLLSYAGLDGEIRLFSAVLFLLAFFFGKLLLGRPMTWIMNEVARWVLGAFSVILGTCLLPVVCVGLWIFHRALQPLGRRMYRFYADRKSDRRQRHALAVMEKVLEGMDAGS